MREIGLRADRRDARRPAACRHRAGPRPNLNRNEQCELVDATHAPLVARNKRRPRPCRRRRAMAIESPRLGQCLRQLVQALARSEQPRVGRHVSPVHPILKMNPSLDFYFLVQAASKSAIRIICRRSTLAATATRSHAGPIAAATRSYTTRRRASAQLRQSRGEHRLAYFKRNALIRSTYCSSSRE